MWNIKLMSLYFMSHILEERYFTTKGWKQKGKRRVLGMDKIMKKIPWDSVNAESTV